MGLGLGFGLELLGLGVGIWVGVGVLGLGLGLGLGLRGRGVGGHQKVVGLCGVEGAVRRAEEPAVELRVERVEVGLVPPAGPTEVRR